MSHRRMTAGFTVVLTALMMPAIQAQDRVLDQYSSPPLQIPNQIPELSAERTLRPGVPQTTMYHRYQDGMPSGPAPTPIDADRPQGTGTAQPGSNAVPPQQMGYVRLGAPMYPTPRPNIPVWSGSTVITNQAFAPQEMLYPHTYRAIYPPFYHRVKGGWLVTPFGVRSHERWELQGTMVQVNYRSNYPGLFSGAFWHPPATSYSGGAWR